MLATKLEKASLTQLWLGTIMGSWQKLELCGNNTFTNYFFVMIPKQLTFTQKLPQMMASLGTKCHEENCRFISGLWARMFKLINGYFCPLATPKKITSIMLTCKMNFLSTNTSQAHVALKCLFMVFFSGRQYIHVIHAHCYHIVLKHYRSSLQWILSFVPFKKQNN